MQPKPRGSPRMKRRTAIALTIAGLVAIAEIFYAANPRPVVTVNTPQSRLRHPPNHPAAKPQPFVTVPAPIAVAASKTDVIWTQYCGRNIDKIDCAGIKSTLAMLPGGSGCGEKYLTIAPAQSANAGFTPRDIFIASGLNIYRLRPPTLTPFAQITGTTTDHTGLTFDHVGTFGYNLIVTTEDGNVWQVTCNPQNSCATGLPTRIAQTFTELEGPA